jgi:hypothetical protein
MPMPLPKSVIPSSLRLQRLVARDAVRDHRQNNSVPCGSSPLGLTQLLEHRLHLRLRMQVAGSPGRGNSVAEHGLRFGHAVGANQRLRGHEVSRSIVRIGLQQDGELCQGSIEVALLGIFHRQPVAGKCVVRIVGEDFVERDDTVHRQISVVDEVSINAMLAYGYRTVACVPCDE